jgi:hypothetical protein
LRLFSALLLAASLTGQAYAREASPSLQDIHTIQQQIVMPARASARSEYLQFYATFDQNGRHMIEGVFVYRDQFELEAAQWSSRAQSPAKDVYIVDAGDLPVIADGGCSVITVMFDRSTGRLARLNGAAGDGLTSINAACNGIA